MTSLPFRISNVAVTVVAIATYLFVARTNVEEKMPYHQYCSGPNMTTPNKVECLNNWASNEDTTHSSPKCGETIFHFSRRQTSFLVWVLNQCVHRAFVRLDIFGDSLGGFTESPLSFTPTHGIRAVKVCAKCSEFSDQGIPGFENYCHDSHYAYDDTVTGMLWLPLDESKGYSEADIKEGGLKTYVYLHGLTSSRGPSQVVPKTLWGWLYLMWDTGKTFLMGDFARAYGKEGKALVSANAALMAASRGMAVLAPDYIGYGDDKSLFKGTGIPRAYQTATLPLWVRAKQMVLDMTNEKAKLLDDVFIQGVSEGGVGALPVGKGLFDMGVKVLAYPGTIPSLDFPTSILYRTFRMLEAVTKADNLSFLAYGAIALASVSPWVNVSRGEAVFSEEGELVVPAYVHSEINLFEGNNIFKNEMFTNSKCLQEGESIEENCPLYLNRKLIENFRKVMKYDPKNNLEYLPCQSKNPSPEFASECAALDSNSLKYWFADIPFKTKYCHAPKDVTAKFINFEEVYPNNTNVELFPKPSEWVKAEEISGQPVQTHAKSSLLCQLIAILDILE